MAEARIEAALGTAIAAPADRRTAYRVMALLASAFALTAPWAGSRLGAVPQFVPLYDTAILVLDVLAAVLLYAQFEQTARRSHGVLACGYVFTPLLVGAHALSIPNAFVPGILLGGPQTAAWLWTVWHATFPLFIAAYALLARREEHAAPSAQPEIAPRRTGALGLAGTIALALAAILVVTLNDARIMPLMLGDARHSSLTGTVFIVTWLIHMTALGVLILCTGLRRLIDLWLAVALVALASEVLLSAVLVDARYQLGFYLGRVYGLLGALFVLGVLLRETVRLSAMTSRLAEEAQSANRAKDAFIAMLGHELRNPLAPIQNVLQLMQLQPGGAWRKERAIIERQVRHMSRLVDDLLDVSRITRGAVELKLASVEMRSVIDNAVETASPLIDSRNHRLALEVPARGLRVRGDAARLAQVISNLLNNAAKFTPAGGEIRVTAQRRDGQVVVEVHDDGVGLSAADQERVFEAFAQGNQSAHRPEGGLGLGLAIARSLARAHGGELSCRSAGPDRGSTFTLTLPRELAFVGPDLPAPEPAAAPPDASRRVLVVDDNVDAAETLAMVLESLGHQPVVAHDGARALELLGRKPVDLALLDIGLPVMDGFELAQRIRQLPNGRAVRLVAVTGFGQESDIARSQASGFELHLVKPVNITRLATLLQPGAGLTPAPSSSPRG